MKHTILLVEDEKKIADTLEAGLEEEQFEVSVAYNGLEGKKLYLNNAYDLIILDINLPFMNGYELCKIIREKDKRIPIIMLTALNFMDNKIQGFDVGADDYIVKPFEFRELLARVKALLRRTDVLLDAPEEKTLTIADLEVNLDNKEVKRSGTKIALTAKEFQLLEYLLKNKGRVVSRADIAKDVWDIDFDTQTNVIDVYVNFLRKKLDKDFTPKLIHTQVGMGYILKTDAD
ncbi:MAG: response regulator transcription factor [Flavipsychrobacter sp.]|jgi:two-component system, OmpR family, copper resistance phosphate regulon response regulator CusR|nr:response regulator transcription factor [Chitinophagales bacterium]